VVPIEAVFGALAVLVPLLLAVVAGLLHNDRRITRLEERHEALRETLAAAAKRRTDPENGN